MLASSSAYSERILCPPTLDREEPTFDASQAASIGAGDDGGTSRFASAASRGVAGYAGDVSGRAGIAACQCEQVLLAREYGLPDVVSSIHAATSRRVCGWTATVSLITTTGARAPSRWAFQCVANSASRAASARGVAAKSSSTGPTSPHIRA